MMVYTDASTDGEFAGLGWVCEPTVENVERYEGNLPIVGPYTSMECEWFALCQGTICASNLGASTVYVHTDCTPLVEKMRWQDDDTEWTQRYELFERLLEESFDVWKFVDINRSGNEDADRLAKEALYRARQSC